MEKIATANTKNHQPKPENQESTAATDIENWQSTVITRQSTPDNRHSAFDNRQPTINSQHSTSTPDNQKQTTTRQVIGHELEADSDRPITLLLYVYLIDNCNIIVPKVETNKDKPVVYSSA
jgi:hypothetical protein